MKKIVFALQIFGLITMFPLYVILELNHVTTKLPSNNKSSGVTQRQEKNISKVSEIRLSNLKTNAWL